MNKLALNEISIGWWMDGVFFFKGVALERYCGLCSFSVKYLVSVVKIKLKVIVYCVLFETCESLNTTQ